MFNAWNNRSLRSRRNNHPCTVLTTAKRRPHSDAQPACQSALYPVECSTSACSTSMHSRICRTALRENRPATGISATTACLPNASRNGLSPPPRRVSCSNSTRTATPAAAKPATRRTVDISAPYNARVSCSKNTTFIRAIIAGPPAKRKPSPPAEFSDCRLSGPRL